jgi:uncharacterized phage protein gp47/JayE
MSLTTLDIINIMRKRGRGDPPSALSDVFVAPLVRVLNFLSSKMDLSRAEQTVDGILTLLDNPDLLDGLAIAINETTETITSRLSNALDDIASNFGIFRRPATAATGSILFMRSTDPQTILPITIVVGTTITAPSINQDYRVASTVVVNEMVRNPSFAKFVVSIPIIAESVGLATNAAAEEINRIDDTVPGIDSVINPSPVSGGRDEESNEELADRIKTALSTNNIGTEVGYRNTVLGAPNINIKDATVIGAGNPLMTRDLGDGGSIDIYVTDPAPIAITQLADASNTVDLLNGTWDFTPDRQPIIADIEAVVPGANVIGVFKDVTVFAGSTKARDRIRFDVDPITLGSPIEFQVNGLVSQVQDFIDHPSRKLLGADILVKEAVSVFVDISCQIAVFSTFSFSVVKTNVENAIVQKISSLVIGQSLELSDMIVVIASVQGVDRVTIPFQKFNKASGTGSINIISAAANEVLRSGNVVVTQ